LKQISEKWMIAAGLGICLCFGAFLRLWNLDAASLWVDEVNPAFAADAYLKTGVDMLPSGEIYGRARMNTLLVAWSESAFGLNEVGARLPSAFLGILSILLVYFLAKDLHGNKTALLAAFLTAFSHFEIGWSRTCRMYTLLQVLTLLLAFGFLRGFEGAHAFGRPLPEGSGKRDRFEWAVRSAWLLLCLILVPVTVFGVHLLGLLLLPGLFLYLFSMALVRFFDGRPERRILNQYTTLLLIMAAGAVFLWISQPGLRSSMREYLLYTPAWAMGTESAMNRMELVEFLISPWQFPLAAFFVVGGLQSLWRREYRSWLPLFLFGTVLFLLSFVFTHRVPAYLFLVYPFFLIPAAYGFMNLVSLETGYLAGASKNTGSRRLMRVIPAAAFFMVLLASPGFRIALKIPFRGDGVTNMAVTPEEWREASQIVKDRMRQGELVISSLPQVAYFYGVRSAYGLNWANLSQARQKQLKNPEGRFIDVYLGAPCIESLEELRARVKEHRSGWVLASAYHLAHSHYIPGEVADYLKTSFPEPLETRRGTVLVFHWAEGGAHGI
jgi:4-amino-4-deoxy-L-arabinose transferase-like glycosyltransferase